MLKSAREGLSRLKHPWVVGAGYEGSGKKRWAEEALGSSAEVVRRPPKPVPEKVARLWAEEWAKEKARGGLAKAHGAAARLPSAAPQQVGGVERTHLRVAEPEPADEQGLREVVRYQRGVHLRCDEEAHGEAIGSCLGIIRQALRAAESLASSRGA